MIRALCVATIVLALASGVAAQRPLSTLTLTVDGVQQSLLPSFSTFGQTLYRFVSEIDATSAKDVQFAWTGVTNVDYKNCGRNLNYPTAANNFEYCPFSSDTFHAASGSFTVNLPMDFTYIQLRVQQGGVNYYYVVLVWLHGKTTDLGYQIFVLEPTRGFYTSVFDTLKTAYTNVIGEDTAANHRPGYMWATQWTASRIEVGYRIGSQCVIDTNGDFVGVSFSTLQTAATPAAGLSGQWNFPVDIQAGYNCVVFRVWQNQGNNHLDYAINTYLYTCNAFTDCVSCMNSASLLGTVTIKNACGWCGLRRSTGTGCFVGDSTGALSATFRPTCSLSNSNWWFSTSFNQGNAVCPPDVIKGDPRIQGLQGQDFQVHGMPNEYFNLVSSPSVQLNSRFVFLSSAACDNFTTCFSHPGTYIDEVGLMVGNDKVRVVAGSMKEGSRVFINGREVEVSEHKHTLANGAVVVTFANARKVHLRTAQIGFTLMQSDKFYNVETQLYELHLLDKGSKMTRVEGSMNPSANTIMHGLIGQTWLNNVYGGDREYEGEVSDYQLQDGLWGSDFKFNLYKN